MDSTTHAVDNPEFDLSMAELILAEGQPLPVDMTARLLEAGVDVSALERRYYA